MNAEPGLLLVDLGGVFFDYDFGRAITSWADAAGVEAAVLQSRFHLDETFTAFECGAISPRHYLVHLRRMLDAPLTNAQLTAGWNSVWGAVNHELVALLHRLDRSVLVPVGASNTNLLHAGQWRATYRDDLPVLAELYCSYELGITKPEPGFFDHVAATHRISRSALVVLDDQPAIIAAATALGIRAHRYRTPAAAAAYLHQLAALPSH
jgi:hypothetical protein